MQVPASLSTPNLHIAFCRLLEQETSRGSSALEAEWYMERCVVTGLSKFSVQHRCLTGKIGVLLSHAMPCLHLGMIARTMEAACTLSQCTIILCRFFRDPLAHGDGGGKVCPELSWILTGPCVDRAMARAKVLHLVEDPILCYGKPQHGKFADPERVSKSYPHFVGDPDRWNSRIVTREANRSAHLYKGPSKRSKGVQLDTIRWVCAVALQSIETHPMFHAVRDAVAEGTDIMQFAELHVFHQCRLSADIMMSSELSCLKRKVVGRSRHSGCITAKSIYDVSGPFVPMHVQFFARVLLKPDARDDTAWRYERRMAWVTPVEYRELNIDGHMVFEDLGDKAPMLIDLELIGRPLILAPGRTEDDNCRMVPFEGKGLLEVQNIEDFVDADVPDED
jgi:hypothetical protein